MNIKREMLHRNIFICVMVKVIYKASKQTLKHYYYKSVTILHLSVREHVRKKESPCTLLKNNETSLARTVTTMFSSKTVNDLTESIIHSHRRLIYVRRFTFVH